MLQKLCVLSKVKVVFLTWPAAHAANQNYATITCGDLLFKNRSVGGDYLSRWVFADMCTNRKREEFYARNV
jgi:hypothetical protein